MGQSSLGKHIIKYRIGKNHPLILALRCQGFTEVKARKAVNLVFDEIKAALVRREEVDLPIGTFRLEKHDVRPFRSWRFGQPQVVYKRRYRVVFEPKDWS